MGDRYSCPFDYFQFSDAKRTNFGDLHLSRNHSIILPNLVFGGGGMLHDVFIEIFKRFTTHPNKRKLIFWGAGINEHDLDKQYFPAFLDVFDLVGLRDFNNPWEYVPCVSCMSSLFDKINSPTMDVIIYEHSGHSIPIDGTKRNNELKPGEDLNTIINFLSQGNTIISNSYHGIYWGQLLGRRTLIFEPFSNRFHGFKYQPPICNRDNWESKLQFNIKLATNYLEECRAINRQFYQKVLAVLK